MYYLDDAGNRVYTLKVRHFWTIRLEMMRLTSFYLQKQDPNGTPTRSAHPARFSPDDKFSKERITCKKRFGILPTQLAPVPY